MSATRKASKLRLKRADEDVSKRRKIHDVSNFAASIKQGLLRPPKRFISMSFEAPVESESSRRQSDSSEVEHMESDSSIFLSPRPVQKAAKKIVVPPTPATDSDSSDCIRTRGRNKSMQTILSSSDSDQGVSSSSPELKPKKRVAVKPKPRAEEPEDTLLTSSSSIFTSLHDSVSTCLTRNKSRLNMSLNRSFQALGQMQWETTLSSLPEWIPKTHMMQQREQSQILAKVEYKPSPTSTSGASSSSMDTKLMPPPPLTGSHESKIRIQDCKTAKMKDLRNWCFVSKEDNICIQGFDIEKGRAIISSEIVNVRNYRIVDTLRSTYQLIGPIDKEKLKAKNIPASIANLFLHGFPKDWKNIILNSQSQKGQASSEKSSKAEKEVISDSKSADDCVVIEEIPAESHQAVLRANPVRWSALTRSKLGVAAASEMKLEPAMGVEDTVIPVIPAESDLPKLSLKDWRIEPSGKSDSCILSGVRVNFKAARRVIRNFSHYLVMKPNILVSKDGKSEIRLVGLPDYQNAPDYIIKHFADGLPELHQHYLSLWQKELSVSRRKIMPPTKYWEGKKYDVRGGKTVVRKNPLADWKNESQESSQETQVQPVAPKQNTKAVKGKPQVRKEISSGSESDEESSSDEGYEFAKNINPVSTTLKAVKKKADYKVKNREKATYQTADFFANSDFGNTSNEEFESMLRSPVQKLKKTANKQPSSPMAAFVSSVMKSNEDSEEDQEYEEEVSDRRKKKTYEKFVFHETNRKDKKQLVSKKTLVPDKTSKSKLNKMKEFLDKNYQRKKKYDRKITTGDDSDTSDYEF